MSLKLTKSWQIAASPDELVDVFLELDQNLEDLLGDFAVRARPSFSVKTKNGSLHKDARSEIKRAVDSIGGRTELIISFYSEPYDASFSGRSVHLSLGGDSKSIMVSLDVNGSDEEVVRGQFHEISNMLNSEIERRYVAFNLKTKIRNLLHLSSKISNHQVIGGLITVGILAALSKFLGLF